MTDRSNWYIQMCAYWSNILILDKFLKMIDSDYIILYGDNFSRIPFYTYISFHGHNVYVMFQKFTWSLFHLLHKISWKGQWIYSATFFFLIWGIFAQKKLKNIHYEKIGWANIVLSRLYLSIKLIKWIEYLIITE